MLQVVLWSFLVFFGLLWQTAFRSGMAERQPELDTWTKEAGAGAGVQDVQVVWGVQDRRPPLSEV